MKKTTLFKTVLLLCALIVGSGSMWADPITLFHETFGNNTGSARTWSDTYSVKSGVPAVYSGITEYTVSNVKQGKNTTGSTQSGLNQSSQGTDAYIIIGPLNVSNYNTLSLKYQWSPGSIKGTYSTSLYYATSSNGSYTSVSGTGATPTAGSSFVERSYSLPDAACVSTLYLKIVWNTSNAQGIIDEVDLKGIENPVGTVKKPIFSVAAGAVAYGKVVSLSQEDDKTIKYTTDGSDPTISSPEYTTPITITGDITIKAIAVDGEETSSVATASYSIKTPDAPSFPKTGEVKAGALITLSQADDEMIIYTTDGTDPSWEPLNGTEYTGAIAVNDAMTIKAIAVDGAENVSSIASADYTIGHGVTTVGKLVTFDFSKSDIWEFPSDYVTSETSYNSDGYTITFGASSNGHKILSSGIIMGKENATLTLPGFGFKVYKIKVYGQDGASTKVTMNFYVGEEAVSNSATNSTEDHEFAIAPSYQAAGNVYVFKVTNANNAQITKIEVYGMEEATISSAQYASFCSASALDFSETAVKAYKAKYDSEMNVVVLTQVDEVPANEGVVLYGAEGSYNIPVIASADEVTNNEMVGVTTETSVVWNPSDGVYNYILQQGTFKKASDGKLRANRAYLSTSYDVTTAGARELVMVFEGEEGGTTGIANANVNLNTNDNYFDLQGRKIAKPTKGLYIVNGKKVVIK